ncbi:hypothetical protein RHMOL_Rhmol04G0076700 [Rhododendron molle]|uniref:Uncharacterized protein n=1 Tax=Rhododendron molle TaxID=49168 RepID=A0ACC0NZT6_RHOML|nr:hypothetical protein RHMOL_Rhmol04G0076700 [Rhododendron molle]
MFRFELVLSFSLSIIFLRLTAVQSKCPKTCDLALGSYYVWPGTNLTFISTASADSIPDILGYNPNITNADSIEAETRINLPFTCDCIDDEFLGHVFPYTVQSGDTYYEIAQRYYANLTTPAMLEQFNSYPASNVPVNAVLNVTVNCSCGDASVSKVYGLFITYPLRVGDSLGSIAADANLSTDLLQSYNPGVDFSAGSGLVYIPGKVESTCSKGCDLALGSYYVWAGTSVRFVAQVSANSVDELISYNPEIPNEYYVKAGTRIDVPFSCDCIGGEFLAHVFTYAVRSGDTYHTIAETYYSNLTTAAKLEQSNSYPASLIPDNAVVNVTVNCSCGNASVSEAYGLFVTYPLRAEDSLESIAAAASVGADLLQSYNPEKLNSTRTMRLQIVRQAEASSTADRVPRNPLTAMWRFGSELNPWT